MQTPGTPREASLPPGLGLWVNERCDRFEDAWSGSERPRVEDFLGETPEPQRSHLLRELVLLDVYYRRQVGEEPRAAEYAGRFPTLDGEWLAGAVRVGRGTDPDGAATLAAVSATPPGRTPDSRLPTVRGYEVLGLLGRGGMGVVYKARHVQLNRVVALKMILTGDLAEPQELARFRREAEAAAQLHHPGIVQVFEIGEQDGLPYLVLEYVNGGSLKQRLDGTPWPARDAAQLLQTVARAMAHAHRHGVVHRDLKPANILLDRGTTVERSPTPHGRPPDPPPPGGLAWAAVATHIPKIADFGLAKLLDSDSGHTRTGAILGTPGYMAPEQAEVKPGSIGPAADVYALGAILYELLTGQPPYRADTPLDTIMSMLNREPTVPSRLNSTVPRDLEVICLKCLARLPDGRYPNAGALADDLDRWLRGESIHARPASAVERFGRWCRRNPVIAALTASVAFLLVLLAAGSFAAALWLRTERNDAVAAREDATEKLWLSYLDRARAERYSKQPGRRFHSLEALQKAAAIRPTLELRNEAVASLGLTDLHAGRTWDGCPADAYALRFDGRLEHYVRTDLQGNLSLRRVADDQETLRLPGEGRPAYVLRFSPDDRFLAVKYHPPSADEDNQLILWDLAPRRKVLELPRMHHGALDFTSDGRRLAVGYPDGTIRLYDVEGAKEAGTLAAGPAPYTLRFDPTNRLLAVSSLRSRSVVLREVETGAVRHGLEHPDSVRGLAWHPGGGQLATACADGNLYLWDADAGIRQAVCRGHESVATAVLFNHRGDLLASSAWDRTVRLWDARNAELLVTVPGVELPGFLPLGFSADDRRLAYQRKGQNVGLWGVTGGQERLVLPRERDQASRVWSADLSPNRPLLAVARGDGVHLWGLADNRLLARLPLKDARSALFHPDGQAILTWSAEGLHRWPLAEQAGEPEATLRIGPPEFLGLKPAGGPEWASLSRDGRLLAAGDRGTNRVIVFDLAERNTRFQGALSSVSSVALSPDGRWVAAGTWLGARNLVRIWDVAAGRKVQDLDLPHGTRVRFSPDSRWLTTGTPEEYRFWRVGDWQPGRVLRTEGNSTGHLAFAPETGLLAFNPTAGLVRLLDPETGAELATFPGGPVRAFSRDGGLLMTTNEVWDLQRVRRHLSATGLDWDQPPFGPVPRRTAGPPPRVEVLDGQAAP